MAGSHSRNERARKTSNAKHLEAGALREIGSTRSRTRHFRCSASFAVALHFEQHAHSVSNGNGHRREPERRRSPRRVLALPVRVRPGRVPWFEEAMAIDFSTHGMRLRSYREYQPGDHLNITFADSASAPWPGSREFRTMVVRVVPVPDSFALDVSVCRIE